MTEQTYTYLLTVETTVKDSAQYGTALESLMDAIATAHRETAAEGIAVRTVLRDTSTIDNTVLDLDSLDDGPNINVDCGHCITPEDRCSDESDRNCMNRRTA